MSGVLRGFASAEYDLYASTKTLVRPCSSGAKHCSATKLLIYELETYPVPNACNAICGWTLSKTANPFMTGVLPASPARKGGVEGSHTRISLFLTGVRSTAARQNPRPEGRGGFNLPRATKKQRQGLIEKARRGDFSGEATRDLLLPKVVKMAGSVEQGNLLVLLVPEGELNPQGHKARRILSPK